MAGHDQYAISAPRKSFDILALYKSDYYYYYYVATVTDFWLKSAKNDIPPSFCELAFHNG